jgi:hypothetical protein
MPGILRLADNVADIHTSSVMLGRNGATAEHKRQWSCDDPE